MANLLCRERKFRAKVSRLWIKATISGCLVSVISFDVFLLWLEFEVCLRMLTMFVGQRTAKPLSFVFLRFR